MSARRRLGGAALGFDEALARGDGEGAPPRIRVCCALSTVRVNWYR